MGDEKHQANGSSSNSNSGNDITNVKKKEMKKYHRLNYGRKNELAE